MTKAFHLLTLLLVFVSTHSAFAHPGHGDSSSSTLGHFLTEPVHLASFLFLGLIVLTAYALTKSSVRIQLMNLLKHKRR